jgi:hypothetical protein
LFVSNRNKPKLNLFWLFFGLFFRETRYETSSGGHPSDDGVRVEEKADGVGGEEDVKEVSLLQLSELAPSV